MAIILRHGVLFRGGAEERIRRKLLDDEHANTFATLLLTDLWSAAKSRGKKEGGEPRPFCVYIDECQNCVTPTIAKNLDQARGFGLRPTLARTGKAWVQ
jgi:hypothetical protein